MRKVLIAALAIALLSFTANGSTWAAQPCPPEVGEAKAALKSAQAAMKKAPKTAKSQEVQAPRAMAGAKSQDVQAPRTQDIQAPRTQDVQAPRTQDVQAPRTRTCRPRGLRTCKPRGLQDVQAPRTMAGAKSPDTQAQIKKASALIREADAACKKGNMTLATQKANEALTLLK